MAGVKGRSGRRPKSAAAHILAGTFRPDRHGLRPRLVVGTTALDSRLPLPPAELVAGLRERGLQFLLDHLERYEDWAPARLVLLREAAGVVDELEDYRLRLAASGPLVLSSRGKSYPNPVVRMQSQARARLIALVSALGLKED